MSIISDEECKRFMLEIIKSAQDEGNPLDEDDIFPLVQQLEKLAINGSIFSLWQKKTLSPGVRDGELAWSATELGTQVGNQAVSNLLDDFLKGFDGIDV